MKDVWLWPQNIINDRTTVDCKQTLAKIEQFFDEYYAPFHAIYFSRARIALSGILAVENTTRSSLTFTQPFSSHCVLSAISECTTPITIESKRAQQHIIYHQWGHKTCISNAEYANPIIEDAVDSLIISNDKDELFPNNAPYCLLSLPKVTKAAIGAVVICQSQQDKEKLLAYRQQRLLIQDINYASHINNSVFQEALLKAVPTLVPRIDDIEQEFIQSISLVKNNVEQMLEYLSSSPQNYDNLIAVGASLHKRLPSNLFINDHINEAECIYKKLPFNVLIQQRTYYDYDTKTCHNVSLFPCHRDVVWPK